jgi:hypothetical protein
MDIGVPYRDMGKVDITALADFVANLPPEAWTQNTFRQDVLASKFHSTTRAITLRHEWHEFAEPWKVRYLTDLVSRWCRETNRNPDEVMPKIVAETDVGPVYEFPQYNDFAAVLEPVIDQIMKLIGTSITGVITRLALVEMQPGRKIEPHIDGQRMAALAHRFHLPLINTRGVVYKVSGKKFDMKLGHLYDFNNSVTHSVKHEGKLPRVNLFFDYYPMKKTVYRNPLTV